jgi:uncharacterized protein (UPF0333 family)
VKIISRGQTLTEFLLVFAVLLIAVSGVFLVCKKFWRVKYEKISSVSAAAAGILKESGSTGGYVK